MIIEFERQGNFQREFLHTKIITVFRGLAALEVFLGHMRNQFFPDYKLVEHPTALFKALIYTTGYGPQAVILFFVMSGWLVGGSLWNRNEGPYVFTNYFLDRMSRLWVVLIPVMLFSLCVGSILLFGLNVKGLIAPEELGLLVFLGNLAGVQNFYVPDYANNLALWSLANETWYYVAFPLMLILLLPKRPVGVKVGSALALAVMAWLLPGKLVAYVLIWLTGVLFSRIKVNVNRIALGLWFLVLLATALVIRYHRWDGTFWPDFLLGVVFAILLAAAKFHSRSGRFPLARWLSEKLSEMSYSLYAVHIPAMFLFVGVMGLADKKLDQASRHDWAIFALSLTFVFTVAYLFYFLFESRTYAVRTFLKTKMGTRGTFNS